MKLFLGILPSPSLGALGVGKYKIRWALAGLALAVAGLFPRVFWIPSAAADGMIARWQLDEGTGSRAIDSVRNVPMFLSQWTRWAPGRSGPGLAFNGRDTYAIAEVSPAWNTPRMTLSLWVVKRSYAAGLIAQREGVWSLAYGPDGEYVWSAGAARVIGSTSNGDLHLWVHLAATHDGAMLRLYKNGELIGSSPGAGELASGDQPIVFGEHAPVSIDDVTLYGSALEQEQIRQIFSSAPPDSVAPSAPSDLRASALSRDTIRVSWTESTDDSGFTGYHLFRDGSPLATTGEPVFFDTGLTPSTTYTYSVRAYDAVLNFSELTGAVTVNTPQPVHVSRVEFDEPVHASGHGDNWHTTWARDDAQYTVLGDGKGWGSGPEYNTRIFQILGGPLDFTPRNLPNYPYIPYTLQKWYGFGILALDNALYHFIGHLDRSGAARFTGAKLVYSSDNGETWLNADHTPMSLPPPDQSNMFSWETPDRTFSLISVLQCGRNYEDNRDGYVYLYSPNGYTDERMRELVMARVPKERLLDRPSYQYFVSANPDGSANWSPQLADRGAVYRFPPNWVASDASYSWHPSVAFVKPLGVYLMTVSATGKNRGKLFALPSYLGVYTAPAPWGPWTQIHEDLQWVSGSDPASRLYKPIIAPKWISEDGRTIHLIQSDAKGWGPPWILPNYKFIVQRMRLVTEAR